MDSPTIREDFHLFIKDCANEIISFLQQCSQNLDSMPDRAIISTLAQFLDLTRQGLHARTNKHSCVSPMDIIEAQTEALRSCLLDLEKVKAMMNQEEKLN